MRYRNSQNFAMVSFEILYHLKLVAVKVFDKAVFGRGEKVMAVAPVIVGNEGDTEDAVLMREQCFVAVAEIQTPDADVFICAGGDNELTVVANVQTQHRQLMPVKRKK